MVNVYYNEPGNDVGHLTIDATPITTNNQMTPLSDSDKHFEVEMQQWMSKKSSEFLIYDSHKKIFFSIPIQIYCFLQTIVDIYNNFLIKFENTGVNTLSITNNERNILANLQTNDDLLHELDDNEQSIICSGDDDTSTK